MRRSVVHPTPLWTWSLVWRRGEVSAAVRAVIDELTRDIADLGLDDETAWLPAADPHRPPESEPKQAHGECRSSGDRPSGGSSRIHRSYLMNVCETNGGRGCALAVFDAPSLRPLGCSPHWRPRCLTLQLSRSEVAMRLLAKAACADVGAVFVHRQGALRPLAPASALGGCPSTAAQYGVAMSARSYDRCRCGASVLRRDSTQEFGAHAVWGVSSISRGNGW